MHWMTEDHYGSISMKMIENVRREVESLGVSFDTMRQEVERMMATADPAATDGRLRQIYFPAGEGTYHLLTVLPSSSLLQVLNGRSRNMRQHRFDCRNEKKRVLWECM